MTLPENLDQASIQDFTDRTPVLVARVSTSGQRESLPGQVKFLKERAKAFGFKKEPEVISIRQSGSAGDLKTLKALRKLVRENPRKKFVVIVRDTPRFARNVNQAMSNLQFLTDKEIPLIPLDMGNPVFNENAPLRKMQFVILSYVFVSV